MRPRRMGPIGASSTSMTCRGHSARRSPSEGLWQASGEICAFRTRCFLPEGRLNRRLIGWLAGPIPCRLRIRGCHSSPHAWRKSRAGPASGTGGALAGSHAGSRSVPLGCRLIRCRVDQPFVVALRVGVGVITDLVRFAPPTFLQYCLVVCFQPRVELLLGRSGRRVSELPALHDAQEHDEKLRVDGIEHE